MNKLSDSYLFYITSVLAIIGSAVLVLVFDFSLINSVIVIHVLLGSVAFLVGGVSLAAKKGSPLHKSSGKIFYVSMVISVAMTLVVSVLPSHSSPSLFQIGVLSLYFLIAGKRSISFKQINFKQASARPSGPNLIVDRALALTVVLVSLLIMSLSVIDNGTFNPLRTVFGTFGIVFGLFDLYLFKQPSQLKKKWLALHLSKMLGGYTAAVTAFFVAQDLLSGYFNWFTPSVVGVSYIAFWFIKLKVFQPAVARQN